MQGSWRFCDVPLAFVVWLETERANMLAVCLEHLGISLLQCAGPDVINVLICRKVVASGSPNKCPAKMQLINGHKRLCDNSNVGLHSN